MTEQTENPQQINLNHLAGMISYLISSLNSGTITIDIDKRSFLRLKINAGYSNKISLEFGQKFIEMILVAGFKSIYDQKV